MGGGATRGGRGGGQVCFTGLLFAPAAPGHHGRHCSQFSVRENILCVRFPSVQCVATKGGGLEGGTGGQTSLSETKE